MILGSPPEATDNDFGGPPEVSDNDFGGPPESPEVSDNDLGSPPEASDNDFGCGETDTSPPGPGTPGARRGAVPQHNIGDLGRSRCAVVVGRPFRAPGGFPSHRAETNMSGRSHFSPFFCFFAAIAAAPSRPAAGAGPKIIDFGGGLGPSMSPIRMV